ncbi:uncharacterized protein LOC136093381 isoform X9 [Hydra vulgaris]|uniref:uncharacterized protein LOC136093381 isoform X9 n=1 Tax=Hydra vulgaris TaxID=6087 RepID=UPI0032EA5DDC
MASTFIVWKYLFFHLLSYTKEEMIFYCGFANGTCGLNSEFNYPFYLNGWYVSHDPSKAYNGSYLITEKSVPLTLTFSSNTLLPSSVRVKFALFANGNSIYNSYLRFYDKDMVHLKDDVLVSELGKIQYGWQQIDKIYAFLSTVMTIQFYFHSFPNQLIYFDDLNVYSEDINFPGNSTTENEGTIPTTKNATLQEQEKTLFYCGFETDTCGLYSAIKDQNYILYWQILNNPYLRYNEAYITQTSQYYPLILNLLSNKSTLLIGVKFAYSTLFYTSIYYSEIRFYDESMVLLKQDHITSELQTNKNVKPNWRLFEKTYTLTSTVKTIYFYFRPGYPFAIDELSVYFKDNVCETCSQNSQCVIDNSRQQCVCLPGFSGDGYTCTASERLLFYCGFENGTCGLNSEFNYPFYLDGWDVSNDSSKAYNRSYLNQVKYECLTLTYPSNTLSLSNMRITFAAFANGYPISSLTVRFFDGDMVNLLVDEISQKFDNIHYGWKQFNKTYSFASVVMTIQICPWTLITLDDLSVYTQDINTTTGNSISQNEEIISLAKNATLQEQEKTLFYCGFETDTCGLYSAFKDQNYILYWQIINNPYLRYNEAYITQTSQYYPLILNLLSNKSTLLIGVKFAYSTLFYTSIYYSEIRFYDESMVLLKQDHITSELQTNKNVKPNWRLFEKTYTLTSTVKTIYFYFRPGYPFAIDELSVYFKDNVCETCSQNSQCVIDNSRQQCVCLPGFSGDGYTCTASERLLFYCGFENGTCGLNSEFNYPFYLDGWDVSNDSSKAYNRSYLNQVKYECLTLTYPSNTLSLSNMRITFAAFANGYPISSLTVRFFDGDMVNLLVDEISQKFDNIHYGWKQFNKTYSFASVVMTIQICPWTLITLDDLSVYTQDINTTTGNSISQNEEIISLAKNATLQEQEKTLFYCGFETDTCGLYSAFKDQNYILYWQIINNPYLRYNEAYITQTSQYYPLILNLLSNKSTLLIGVKFAYSTLFYTSIYYSEIRFYDESMVLLKQDHITSELQTNKNVKPNWRLFEKAYTLTSTVKTIYFYFRSDYPFAIDELSVYFKDNVCETCSQNSQCVIDNSRQQCVCLPGFSGDGYTCTGIPQLQASSTLPHLQASSSLLQLQATITLPHLQASSTLPQSQSSSTLPHLQASSSLPQLQASSSLSHLQATSSLPQLQVSITLPQLQALSTLTHLQATSSLPQLQVFITLPQLQALSTLPHLQASSTLPHLQSSSSLLQLQASSTLTHLQATSSLPQLQVFITLPHLQSSSSLLQLQASSTLTHLQATSSLPQLQVFITLPQLQALSTLPHLQASSTLPHLQSSSSLLQLQASSSLLQLQASSTLPHLQSSSSLPQLQASSSLSQLQASSTFPYLQASSTSPHLQALSNLLQLQASSSLLQLQASSTFPLLQSSSTLHYLLASSSLPQLQASSSLSQLQASSSLSRLQTSSNNIYIIVLAILVPVLFVLIIIVIAVLLRNLKKNVKLQQSRSRTEGSNNENSINLNVIANDDWEISPDNISIDKKIGEGAFGTVFSAKISTRFIAKKKKYNQILSTFTNSEDSTIYVAVKLLKEGANQSESEDFYKEISLMKKINYHENIVNIIGCSTIKPLCLIVEFMENGDLLQFLRSRRNKTTKLKNSSSQCLSYEIPVDEMLYEIPVDENGVITPHDLISFAWQIASGMEYLTFNKIVHRDLAARNILVGAEKNVKISDFGLARRVNNELNYKSSKNRPLPIKWMSVEAIFDQLFSSCSDVYVKLDKFKLLNQIYKCCFSTLFFIIIICFFVFLCLLFN